MKAYYYGEKTPGLIGKIEKFAFENKWCYWLAVLLILVLRIFLVPPIWILVMIGEIGHTFASGLGFSSRDW